MNLENCQVHLYSSDILTVRTERGQKSQFDDELESSWQDSMDKGYFRYGLQDVQTKCIPGKYGFIAQLNIRRAVDRRKPQFISDITMPFDADIFHFGKVAEHEILFLLNPLHWEKEENSGSMKTSSNALIINVSPLEFCHSLLVPSIEKCYPQVLTFSGLRLALETMLISYNSSLRLGFNSLGAYASVNHLHFHVYYLKQELFLQHAPVKHLVGDCYELEDFPAKGFAFQLVQKKAVVSLVKSIMKLIEYLLVQKIPHNIFMTRGQDFAGNSKKKDMFNAIRIYVWAREASFGRKNDLAFNPALCELGGHLPIKDKAYFESATEEDISLILQNVCQEMFCKVKEEVQHIYAEC